MGIVERRNREKEQRQQLIIAAARKVVSNKGFRNTTIEHIAAEAEISPGTIYLYFKNKEELFSSLVLQALYFLELRIKEVCNTHSNASINIKINALHDILIDAYNFDPLISTNMFHLLSVENLNTFNPSLLCQVKQLFNSMLQNLIDIFSENNDDTQPTVIFKGMEDFFFILLSGLSVWSGFAEQIIENGASKDYSERCNALIDLFYEVSKLGRQQTTNSGVVEFIPRPVL